MISNENTDYVSEGLKLVYFDRKDEWKNAVQRASLTDIKETLKIMKELQNAKSDVEVRAVAEKYYGKLTGDVLAMVLGFSKKGPEFLIAYDPAYYDENAERKFIDKVWANNRRCAGIESVSSQQSLN